MFLPLVVLRPILMPDLLSYAQRAFPRLAQIFPSMLSHSFFGLDGKVGW